MREAQQLYLIEVSTRGHKRKQVCVCFPLPALTSTAHHLLPCLTASVCVTERGWDSYVSCRLLNRMGANPHGLKTSVCACTCAFVLMWRWLKICCTCQCSTLTYMTSQLPLSRKLNADVCDRDPLFSIYPSHHAIRLCLGSDSSHEHQRSMSSLARFEPNDSAGALYSFERCLVGMETACFMFALGYRGNVPAS